MIIVALGYWVSCPELHWSHCRDLGLCKNQKASVVDGSIVAHHNVNKSNSFQLKEMYFKVKVGFQFKVGALGSYLHGVENSNKTGQSVSETHHISTEAFSAHYTIQQLKIVLFILSENPWF